MSGDNVVVLAFRNEKDTVEGERDMISCAHCRNKTFLMIAEQRDAFPLLQCAACGSHIGNVGWAPEEGVS